MARKPSSQKYSAELCEKLHSAPKHVVSTIRWEPIEGGARIFQATVLTDDELTLDLIGYWEPATRFSKPHWGFALRYQGHVVRTYDMAKSHKNPGEPGRVKGPHKHKFISSKIDRYAYTPDPPISTVDPHEALADFLTECNIDFHPMLYPDFNVPLG